MVSLTLPEAEAELYVHVAPGALLALAADAIGLGFRAGTVFSPSRKLLAQEATAGTGTALTICEMLIAR
jgi:hypothetical protein